LRIAVSYSKQLFKKYIEYGGEDKKQCLKIFPIIQFFSEPLTQYPHYS